MFNHARRTLPVRLSTHSCVLRLGALAVIAATLMTVFPTQADDHVALLANLNSTLVPYDHGSDPAELMVTGSVSYFRANDSRSGSELWRSDGTANGTHIVKDIWPGSSGSTVQELTMVNGTLFFSATNETYDQELWKSDGTTEGTVMVKDIFEGPFPHGSQPLNLTAVGDTLFFTALDSEGNGLWRSGNAPQVQRQWLVILFVITTLLFSHTAIGLARKPLPPSPVAGEILVKFRPGTNDGIIKGVHRQHSAQWKRSLPGIGVQVVHVPVGQEQIVAELYAQIPHVVFAETNGRYKATGITTDPSIGSQWQYQNTGQTGGIVDADIDAVEAWEISRGSDSVAIAILDTGIDQTHGDLRDKIVKNVDVAGSGTVDDMNGHGTHVGGSAAASTDNGVGVAGTCPHCVLYNVKVLDDVGLGDHAAIAEGITWAADNGAAVINLSLGGDIPSRTVEESIAYAWSRGVVVIASAGNNGTTTLSYPAAYPHVISVAATDDKDIRASWSTYGSWVDVAAPGVNILSTLFNSTYTTASGTSMAAPHVAGIAGLMVAQGLSAADIADRLCSTADTITTSETPWRCGRVNARKAVGDVIISPPIPTPAPSAQPVPKYKHLYLPSVEFVR